MNQRDVIIACDFSSAAATFDFLDRFTGRKPFVKIGMELYYAEGPSIVREIKARGHKIFLDLKLHDIPNTVKKAMAVLSRLDVDMCNLHAAGTIDMMRAALEGLTRPDGTRPLLIEIQALVGTTPYPTPRRVTNGVDTSRVLQILAVLEKRVGLNLSKQDVYVNVMGGIDVYEPSADLGIALAVATCARDVVVDPQTVIIGEIGLSGEIHPVNNIDKIEPSTTAPTATATTTASSSTTTGSTACTSC